MPGLLWITFVGSASVILLCAIPMAMGKVPPNALYGVRLPVTLRDRAAWDAANVHFGRWMILSGVSSLGVFFLGLMRGWTVDFIAMVYVIVMMIPLMFGIVHSVRAAMRAERESNRNSDDESPG